MSYVYSQQLNSEEITVVILKILLLICSILLLALVLCTLEKDIQHSDFVSCPCLIFRFLLYRNVGRSYVSRRGGFVSAPEMFLETKGIVIADGAKANRYMMWGSRNLSN